MEGIRGKERKRESSYTGHVHAALKVGHVDCLLTVIIFICCT